MSEEAEKNPGGLTGLPGATENSRVPTPLAGFLSCGAIGAITHEGGTAVGMGVFSVRIDGHIQQEPRSRAHRRPRTSIYFSFFPYSTRTPTSSTQENNMRYAVYWDAILHNGKEC
jgi:hypothetical protein